MRLTIVTVVIVLGLPGCAQAVDRLALRLGLVEPSPDRQPTALASSGMASERSAALDALARDDLPGAVAALRRYTDAAPAPSPRIRAALGYITLLQREVARREAQAALRREQDLQASGRLAPAASDRLRIALMPFEQREDRPGGKPFNRAMLAMITSDLAQVPALQLLERERIDALVNEMQLGAGGLVDPTSAVRAGKLLGAGTVIVGSVFDGAPPLNGPAGAGKYTLNATLADVPSNNVIGAREAYGTRREFFILEKRIVHGILELLEIRDYPAAVDKVHTRNWDAYAQFTLGLKHLAEERYDDARAAFAQALRLDPGFTLAEQYHLATPARPLSLVQLRQEAGSMLSPDKAVARTARQRGLTRVRSRPYGRPHCAR
jgi:tetratricopeptide (TPR) repeat protein